MNNISVIYQSHRQRYKLSLLITLIMLSIMAIFALKFGAINLSWQEILHNDEISRQVLVELRLPRIITTIITGISLAVAGVLMQGLFRNPMADPSLIGMSSGASLAAMIFILLSSQQLLPLWLNNIGLSLSAFIGSLLVALLTYSLSARKGNSNIGILLLAGIAINALCGSIIGLLTYIANDDALRSITFWSMGSFANSDYNSVGFILCAIFISIPILKNTPKFLDSLLIGESYTKILGLNLTREKNKLIFIIAILVGTCTAFVGPIGFVGLIIPHIVRMIIGSSSHKKLLILSSISGALLLTIADLIARTIVVPSEVPIGIITALIGAPYFTYLLYKRRTQIGY